MKIVRLAGYNPTTRDYCNTLVVDTTNNKLYFFDCNGVYQEISGLDSGALQGIVAGENISIDTTDPTHPIISAVLGDGTVQYVRLNSTTTQVINSDIQVNGKLETTDTAGQPRNVASTNASGLELADTTLHTNLQSSDRPTVNTTNQIAYLSDITTDDQTTPRLELYIGKRVDTAGNTDEGIWARLNDTSILKDGDKLVLRHSTSRTVKSRYHPEGKYVGAYSKVTKMSQILQSEPGPWAKVFGVINGVNPVDLYKVNGKTLAWHLLTRIDQPTLDSLVLFNLMGESTNPAPNYPNSHLFYLAGNHRIKSKIKTVGGTNKFINNFQLVDVAIVRDGDVILDSNDYLFNATVERESPGNLTTNVSYRGVN